MPGSAAAIVPASAARGLLLDGQGLLRDPARRATPREVLRVVEALGFVQVDTINAVERAHHHILHSRLDGYRPAQLARLLERDRALFEHWTHDASVIRADWLPHWRHRFDDYRRSGRLDRWLQTRLGPDGDRVVRAVWRKISREGPLMSRDFDDTRAEPGGWWNWKPSRAALEVLWRIGRLSIHGRRNFQKIYDRTDRVFPGLSATRKPTRAAHREWACRAALERLGVATPIEITRFLRIIDVAEVRAWTQRAARRGDVAAVRVEDVAGGAAQAAYALPDWEARAARLADPPDRIRLLSPFDPLIHDRARTARRFGFDYTIECFVPASKRRYGYYVLPILEGERIVGRLDPKLDRATGVFSVQQIWWEPDVRATPTRLRALDVALDRFTGQLGAERFERPAG